MGDQIDCCRRPTNLGKRDIKSYRGVKPKDNPNIPSLNSKDFDNFGSFKKTNNTNKNLNKKGKSYLNSIYGDEYEFPYLLVIQDHFSKFCMAYPLRNKTAETVLKKIKKFFSYYGEPEQFGSDNGKEFVNSLLINFLNSKNIDFIRGMPYNPHSRGSDERLHQTLKKSLFAVYNEFLTSIVEE